jgi:hypothetical protein
MYHGFTPVPQHAFASPSDTTVTTASPESLLSFMQSQQQPMQQEDEARTHYYRARISAFYRHYQPDKPASHVEFLLCKYRGMEEDVLATLREKYGPEPALDGSGFTRKAATGIHREDPRLAGGSGGASSSVALESENSKLMQQLVEKQNIFQRDMWLLQEQGKRAEASAIGVSLQEARKVAQRQEVELQQLRHTLSALKSEYAVKAEAQRDAIEKASRELTLAKLRHMQASMTADGARVPADEMQSATDAIVQIDENLRSTVDYGRKLVAVLQRHLFLYPMSPVRMTLEELDPSIAARLEVSMSASQQE